MMHLFRLTCFAILLAGACGDDPGSLAPDAGTSTADATIAPADALPPGPPVAAADRYDAVGNTELVVAAVAGVLGNDADPEGTPLRVDDFDARSQLGAEVNVDGDGSFTYRPPLGATGTDAFSYRVVDADGMIATGTVSIALTERVWYVDNTAVGGDGRSWSPLSSLSDAAAAGTAGDTLYVARGDGTSAGLTGTIVLQDRRLVGEGVALVVDGHQLRPAGDAPLLAADEGPAVVIHGNATLAGVRIEANADSAISITTEPTTAPSPIVVEHVDLTAGRGGIDVDTRSPLDLTLRAARIQAGTTAAVRIVNVPAVDGTSRIAIHDVEVSGPPDSSAAGTGIVVVFATDAGCQLDLTIADNRLERVRAGVDVTAYGSTGDGIGGHVRARILGNRVTGFRDTAVSATFQASPVARIDVAQNVIDGAADAIAYGGISLDVKPSAMLGAPPPRVDAIIDGNAITAVQRGVHVSAGHIAGGTTAVLAMADNTIAAERIGARIETRNGAATMDATLTKNAITGVQEGAGHTGVEVVSFGQTRIHLVDNDVALRYELDDVGPQLGIAGPTLGTFEDDDGGNIAATGNTTGGGPPVIQASGTITGISPADVAVPAPLP